MNRDKIIADLSVFLSKVAVIPLEEITMEDSLDTLGVDSAAIISLAAHIEEQYCVVADADDLPKNSTIEQITDFVMKEGEV